MAEKKIGDFIGYSKLGIQEAIQDALKQAGEHMRFEVVETRCSRADEQHREYQVTLATFSK